MAFALGQLTLLAIVILALLVFGGIILYHRLRQEVVIRRWFRARDSGRRREAWRRAAVRARRTQPILRVCLQIAVIGGATLLLTQIIENILRAF